MKLKFSFSVRAVLRACEPVLYALLACCHRHDTPLLTLYLLPALVLAVQVWIEERESR